MQTLRHYVRLRLQNMGWDVFSKYVTWSGEENKGCVWVVGGYRVGTPTEVDEDSMVVPVVFRRSGLFCFNLIFKPDPEAVTYNYELVRYSDGWKINNPVPDYPDVAVNIVQQMLAKASTDVTISPDRRIEAERVSRRIKEAPVGYEPPPPVIKAAPPVPPTPAETPAAAPAAAAPAAPETAAPVIQPGVTPSPTAEDTKPLTEGPAQPYPVDTTHTLQVPPGAEPTDKPAPPPETPAPDTTKQPDASAPAAPAAPAAETSPPATEAEPVITPAAPAADADKAPAPITPQLQPQSDIPPVPPEGSGSPASATPESPKTDADKGDLEKSTFQSAPNAPPTSPSTSDKPATSMTHPDVTVPDIQPSISSSDSKPPESLPPNVARLSTTPPVMPSAPPN